MFIGVTYVYRFCYRGGLISSLIVNGMNVTTVRNVIGEVV